MVVVMVVVSGGGREAVAPVLSAIHTSAQANKRKHTGRALVMTGSCLRR